MLKNKFLVIGLISIVVLVLIFVISLIKGSRKDSRIVFVKDIEESLEEDYSVKDTIFDSLDGENQHVVAIFHWKSEDGLDQQDSLSILELRGEKLIEVFSSTEWLFKLGNELRGDYVRANDINEDEVKEIIVTRSQGGNCWTCTSLRIFQIKEHKSSEFLVNLPETQVIYGIKDLDEDGDKELIVANAEWEFYMELCHSCSPSVDIVYTWKDNSYQESSSEFLEYYKERINMIEKQIQEMGEEEIGSEYYIGKAVSIFLNYIQKGEKVKGWEVFTKYMSDENFKDKSFINTAKRIVRDLEKKFLNQ